MTRNRFLLLGCSLMVSGCINQVPPGSRPSPSPTSLVAADRIWITGSSNIRQFTCIAGEVYLSAEAAPEDFQRTKDDGLPAVRSAALQVPVRSLDCGIGLQNRHLLETVDATAHPGISFTLGNYAVEPTEDVRRVRIQGVLRIRGVERNVVLHGTVFRDPAGRWMLRGDRAIDMRDFGIAPPRRFLGLLRVKDEITVHFVVAVRPLIDPLGVLTASLQ